MFISSLSILAARLETREELQRRIDRSHCLPVEVEERHAMAAAPLTWVQTLVETNEADPFHVWNPADCRFLWPKCCYETERDLLCELSRSTTPC